MLKNMLKEQLRNARVILDANPAVERNDYGEYEPRCVMEGKYIRTMEDNVGEAYGTPDEAMKSAESALAAFKERAQQFIEDNDPAGRMKG